MKMTTPNDVGHYIASTRKALRWSQQQLAKKIGKDQRFVSKLENDPSSVAFGTVMAVLKILDVQIDMATGTNGQTSDHKQPAAKYGRTGRDIPNTNAVGETPTKFNLARGAGTGVKKPAIVTARPDRKK